MKKKMSRKIIMRCDQNRISFVANLINTCKVPGESICDLGSRDEVLLESITKDIKYLGVDIYPIKENTIYSDIEKQIETSDQFDIVTAIDVLEHTNDINNAINELLRVCRGTFVINLPNELTLLYRFRLLFGQISGKYLVNLSSLDRHRWFFNLENVEQLITQSNLRNHELDLIAFYRKGGLLSKLNRMLGLLGLHSIGAHSFIIIGRKM
jgi:2-polyprenyl-3-methyl-5-hydroxy-6-metoxy-1,4-benzoquinol methylase